MNNRVIRRAIYQKITGSAAITALLGNATSVFHEVAPPGSPHPYVIFALSAGSDRHLFGARAFRQQTWLIKAVARTDTHDVADNIDAAIDSLLFNASITLESGELLDVRRVSDVSYLEENDGNQIRHSGGLYRFTFN